MFQVKPTRAGSSIGVTVAYGLADSLSKANAVITEVVFVISLFPFFFSFLNSHSSKCFKRVLTMCMNLDHVGLNMNLVGNRRCNILKLILKNVASNIE